MCAAKGQVERGGWARPGQCRRFARGGMQSIRANLPSRRLCCLCSVMRLLPPVRQHAACNAVVSHKAQHQQHAGRQHPPASWSKLKPSRGIKARTDELRGDGRTTYILSMLGVSPAEVRMEGWQGPFLELQL